MNRLTRLLKRLKNWWGFKPEFPSKFYPTYEAATEDFQRKIRDDFSKWPDATNRRHYGHRPAFYDERNKPIFRKPGDEEQVR